MNIDNRIPLFFGHIKNHPVTKDTSAVDQDVEPTERINRCLNETLTALHSGNIVGVSSRLTTSFLDFIHQLLSRTFIRSFTRNTPAEIVHHNLRSLLRHEQRDTASNAASRTSDSRHLPIEFTHCVCPPFSFSIQRSAISFQQKLGGLLSFG